MRGRRCWILLILAVLAACSSARRRVDGDVLRHVRFHGNGHLLTAGIEGQSDYTLRQQILNQASPSLTLTFPFTYLRTPTAFQADFLADDARRLETWYAHHGWFDARLEGWQIQRVKPRTRKRGGAVDLIGHIQPGPRSQFRALEIEGLRKESAGIGRSVRRTGLVQPGYPFDHAGVIATRDQLRAALHDHSYAYAQVTDVIDAYPAETSVDVMLRVDQGIQTRFGELRVSGQRRVSAAHILDELQIPSGTPYKLDTLRKAQQRLFDLGTFSIVTVIPDLSNTEARDVPIDVHVTESKFRTIRAGTAVDYDGFTLSPRLSTNFRHNNLFGTMTRFEGRLEGGFSGNFAGDSLRAIPVFEIYAGLSQPRLFGNRHWTLNGRAEIEQNMVNAQLPMLHPQIEVTVAWRPRDEFVLSFGPHWEQHRFYELDGARMLQVRALLGENFRNPYQLTMLELDFTLDATDDPLNRRRGQHLSGGFRQAIPFGSKDFSYSEVNIDARAYRVLSIGKDRVRALRALTPETVAARLHVQALHPWGDSPLPYPELARLGGSNSIRGYLTDRVGPYDCLCLTQPIGDGDAFSGRPGAGSDARQIYLEQGGAFSALTSAELRYALGVIPGTGVLFTDIGILSPSMNRILVDQIRFGSGFGYRYPSPVGPIRLDFAFRPLAPEDAGPQRYLDCDGSDQIPRSYDLFSLSRDRRELSERSLPFAVAFYFALGEAI